MAEITPSQFAWYVNSRGIVSDNWTGGTERPIQYSTTMSGHTDAIQIPNSNWFTRAKDAIVRGATEAVNTAAKTMQFPGAYPATVGVAKATTQMGEGAKEVLSSTANAITRAGGGIAAGVKWAGFVLVLVAGLFLLGYVLRTAKTAQELV